MLVAMAGHAHASMTSGVDVNALRIHGLRPGPSKVLADEERATHQPN